jgi:hypothetical protein
VTFARGSPIAAFVLSDLSGLEPDGVNRTLAYMVEGSWWSSYSSGEMYPEIQPSEAILKYNSFSDIIKQMRSWQAASINDRRQSLAKALRNYKPTDNNSTSDLSYIKPDWFGQLPNEKIRNLLDEIYIALNAGLQSLPAMGMRALIDVVCLEQVGDLRTFSEKLQKLKEKELITENQRSALDAVFDAGSASAHRGYIPERQDLRNILEIAEHLLKGIYILPVATEQIKSNTPQRNPRK